MARLDFRGARLDLNITQGADHALTVNFTGLTVTGDTLALEVYNRGSGALVQSFPLTISDADTAVLTMNDVTLDLGTYGHELRSTLVDTPLWAGDLRVHPSFSPRQGA